VVAAGVGGLLSLVDDQRTGLIVDEREPAAFAAAVDELLADPDRAARMGAAGRRWAVDNWQWKDQAARLSDLL
jgi:phosphatidylinositol alpha-1,6-mannosyltransferase